MSSIEVGAVIIAITQAIKTQVPQVNGIVTIALAGILGVLAGLAGIGGLNWLSGLSLGLASAGAMAAAKSAGGSNVSPK